MRAGREVAEDLWLSRDLPMLEAVAELEEEGQGHRWLGPLVEKAGFDEATVKRSLNRLAGECLTFKPIRGDGDLLELVEQRMEDAHDEEERGRLQRFLEAAQGLGGRALQELTLAYLKRHAPGLD